MKYSALMTIFALTACGPAADEPVPNTLESATETATEEQAWVNPHPTYCFMRVGQIGAEPKRGEPCEINASGSGAYMADLDRPERNGVTVSLSSPALEKVGVGGCPSSYNLSQISARAKRDFAHRVV